MTGRRKSGRSAAVVASTVVLALGGSIAAQTQPPRQAARPAPRAGTWEVGGGGAFVGGYDLGDRPANLSPNLSGGSNPFLLFDTSSDIGVAPGLQARLGFFVSRSLLVEGGLRYAKPELTIRATGDTEGAVPVSAVSEVSQYLVDGSAVWHFHNASFAGGRGVPFVVGGAGYLRELHEGNELIETGVEYHAGGGLKYWFGSAPRRFGLRGEAALSIRDGGIDFEEGRRTVPVASVTLVYIF
ncbi:MAG TPA: hypothetical protein VLD67_13360 [Vicinamibacterales bacterium]|nr:hypothetical protein [Vicinamibacterales bacterium]